MSFARPMDRVEAFYISRAKESGAKRERDEARETGEKKGIDSTVPFGFIVHARSLQDLCTRP